MARSSSLENLGKTLDVTQKDVEDLRRAESKQRILSVTKIGLPILTFLAGLVGGLAAASASSNNDAYPYTATLGALSVRGNTGKSGWFRTIVVSVATLILGIVLGASTFGVSTLYSSYSR